MSANRVISGSGCWDDDLLTTWAKQLDAAVYDRNAVDRVRIAVSNYVVSIRVIKCLNVDNGSSCGFEERRGTVDSIVSVINVVAFAGSIIVATTSAPLVAPQIGYKVNPECFSASHRCATADTASVCGCIHGTIVGAVYCRCEQQILTIVVSDCSPEFFTNFDEAVPVKIAACEIVSTAIEINRLRGVNFPSISTVYVPFAGFSVIVKIVTPLARPTNVVGLVRS